MNVWGIIILGIATVFLIMCALTRDMFWGILGICHWVTGINIIFKSDD